jgi:hypothetical protein
MTVASANEKKHAQRLFEKALCRVKIGKLVADPQCCSQNLRDAAIEVGTVPLFPILETRRRATRVSSGLTGNSEAIHARATMLLISQAALNTHKPSKTRSFRYFAN